MDAAKIRELMELIEKASVPLPGSDGIDARAQAIITKAEADIDAELAL